MTPVPGSRDAVATVLKAAMKAESVPIVTTVPDRARWLAGLLHAMPGNSLDIQCERLLIALRDGPVTLRDARRWLDIAHPSECVRLLRRDGIEVLSDRVKQASEAGVIHRTALYSLPAE